METVDRIHIKIDNMNICGRFGKNENAKYAIFFFCFCKYDKTL